jgi:hypothetical protein
MLFIFLFVWKRISDTWSSSCWPTRGELLWDDRSLANRHVFACGQGCFPSVLISFFFISKASSYQCHLLHNLCTFSTLVLPWDRTLNTFEYLSGRPQNMCTVTIFWLSCGLRSHWEVDLLATSPAPPFWCVSVCHTNVPVGTPIQCWLGLLVAKDNLINYQLVINYGLLIYGLLIRIWSYQQTVDKTIKLSANCW